MSRIFESFRYSQDGYGEFIFTATSYFSESSFTSFNNFSSDLFTELLGNDWTFILIFPSLFSVFITPKFIEVSTSPSISLLIAITPFGNSWKNEITAFVLEIDIFPWFFNSSFFISLTSITGFLSIILKSFVTFSKANFANFSKSLTFSSSSFTASNATASLGIALVFSPPSISIIESVYFLFKWFKTSVKILLEFPSPKWISAPECPPRSPFTSTLITVSSSSSFSASKLNSLKILAPPALLT